MARPNRRPLRCWRARQKGEETVRPFSTLRPYHFHPQTLCRATKGIGRTQPVDWKDAGEALGHNELKGCLMPKGLDDLQIFPNHALIWIFVNSTGKCVDVNPPGANLRYNEVCRTPEPLCGYRTGLLNLFFFSCCSISCMMLGRFAHGTY